MLPTYDIKGGCDVLKSDAGYRGTAVEFVENTLQRRLHISKKSKMPLLFCQCCGLLNEPLPGLGISGACPGIMKSSPIPLKI
ncbi:hypothetical protein SAMN05421690_100599 [Nitrosomonas sp. Nm51]|nr:hypothetical protein SAMN05421690_100599 [Nitrosomonas sp. Nm51]